MGKEKTEDVLNERRKQALTTLLDYMSSDVYPLENGVFIKFSTDKEKFNLLRGKIYKNDETWITEVHDSDPHTVAQLVINLLEGLRNNQKPLIAENLINNENKVDKDALKKMPVKNVLILIKLIEVNKKIMEDFKKGKNREMGAKNLSTALVLNVFPRENNMGHVTSTYNTYKNSFKKIIDDAQSIRDTLEEITSEQRDLLSQLNSKIREQSWPEIEGEKLKSLPNGKRVPEEIKKIHDSCVVAIEAAKAIKPGEIGTVDDFNKKFEEVDKLISKAAKPRSLLYKIIQKIDVAHLFTVSAKTDQKYKDLKTAIKERKEEPPEPDQPPSSPGLS